eukprot:SAG31_NODE_1069_length_10077_cov_2.403588_13_plen_96_part_01
MSHYLSDADRRYGRTRATGFECRATVVAWPAPKPKRPQAGKPTGGPRAGKDIITQRTETAAALQLGSQSCPLSYERSDALGLPERLVADCIFTLAK